MPHVNKCDELPEQAGAPDASPMSAGDILPPPVAGGNSRIVGALAKFRRRRPCLAKAGAGVPATYEYRIVNNKEPAEPDAASEAVAELQEGLDHAKQLVERTRLLLTGETAHVHAAKTPPEPDSEPEQQAEPPKAE